MSRLRLATVWLSGCSGCHMSLLNLHEGLLGLFDACDLLYSPLADVKEFPKGVDCVLVEGAVANEENREMALLLRERSVVVVSLGDCAVNGNVPGLRNPLGPDLTLEPAYHGRPFSPEVPRLSPRVLPLHQVIRVDAFLPGCPPPASEIVQLLEQFCTGLAGVAKSS